jgi:hypothetical protein
MKLGLYSVTYLGIWYRGEALTHELCHPLPVVNGQTVGIEFAHRNAELASEFMRQIIKP